MAGPDVLRIRENLPPTEGGNPVQEVRFKVREDINVIADYRHGGKKAKSLILNLHGLLCSKEMAKGIFADDASTENSILNVDLVGFGKSSRPKGTFGYTMEEQADVLVRVLDQIDYDDITIYAHSMSGPIGVYLAEKLLEAKNGKKVTALRSLEGNTVTTDCGIVSREIAKTSIEHLENEMLPGFISSLENSDSEGERQWAEEMRTADPEIVKLSAASLVKESDRPYDPDKPNLLQRLIALKKEKDIDVTYVWGEDSDQYKASEAFLKPQFEANGINVIIIPGVGHFVQDYPNLWSRLINNN